MVDSVIVLCRIGKTTVPQADKCAALLDQVGAPAIGVVLVGVDAPAGSAYFSYHSMRRDRPPPVVAPVAEGPASATEPGGDPGGPGADPAVPGDADVASDADPVASNGAGTHGSNGHAPDHEPVAAPADEPGPP